MLIKFFRNGKGAGAGPVGYLVADRVLAYDGNRDLIRDVDADVTNDFLKAKKPVDDVEKATRSAAEAIRGCRVIPKDFSETFEAGIEKVCQTIREKIEKEQSEIPNYDTKDDVVSRLEKALLGGVGALPDDIENLLKEARRRRDEKIPPGYMDEQKDGLGFAGDFLMWTQIMSHSSKEKKPVILVTSETKEDWWEKKSGKTLNPRLELLQEAFEKTGQKFLIYHTDQFLRIHQDKSGEASDESILEEIREYSLAREPAVSITQETTHLDVVQTRLPPCPEDRGKALSGLHRGALVLQACSSAYPLSMVIDNLDISRAVSHRRATFT